MKADPRHLMYVQLQKERNVKATGVHQQEKRILIVNGQFNNHATKDRSRVIHLLPAVVEIEVLLQPQAEAEVAVEEVVAVEVAAEAVIREEEQGKLYENFNYIYFSYTFLSTRLLYCGMESEYGVSQNRRLLIRSIL